MERASPGTSLDIFCPLWTSKNKKRHLCKYLLLLSLQGLGHWLGCGSSSDNGVNLVWKLGGCESGFENWGSWVLIVQQKEVR